MSWSVIRCDGDGDGIGGSGLGARTVERFRGLADPSISAFSSSPPDRNILKDQEKKGRHERCKHIGKDYLRRAQAKATRCPAKRSDECDDMRDKETNVTHQINVEIAQVAKAFGPKRTARQKVNKQLLDTADAVGDEDLGEDGEGDDVVFPG